MTQPIQEPSLTRTDAALGWSSRQLMRRPAPVVSPSEYPLVFRALEWNIDTTCPTGSMTELEFDFWSNPDATVFDPNLNGSGNLRQVDLLQAGYVVITLIVEWPDFNASIAAMINDLEQVFVPPAAEYPRNLFGSYFESMTYFYTYSRYYPTIDWEEGHGGNELPQFSFLVAQASGVDRDARGRFDISYWPATIGPITEA